MTRILSETIEIGTLRAKNDKEIDARFPIEKEKGLCVLCNDKNRSKLLDFFQFFILEIVRQTPKELLKFHLFDPLGMGGNLKLLTTIDKEVRGGRIYNKREDIDKILSELEDLLEHNIQNVLGFQYDSISDYNSNTKELPLQYNFLAIVDFPSYLEKKHLEKLNRLIQNGRKAGIYLLLFIDTAFQQDEFEGISPIIFLNKIPVLFEADENYQVKNFSFEKHFNENFKFKIHSHSNEYKENVIKGVINQSKIKKSVAISLSEYLSEKNLWTKSSIKGIDIPIGKTPTGIANLVFENSSFHALVGGQTGSGKTVLLHNIITLGSWLYSPKELQFCLLDYKEGTEFNIYKNLPHIKVLSIESEIEFGLSFLDYIQAEIKQRGELFKEAGVAKISTYRKNTGLEMPRLVIIIDEFQVLFGKDYGSSEFVADKLDDILKRGRSFGIHLILSSQSLSEIQMKSSSYGQLKTRIALSMSKDDSRRVLDDNNIVPASFNKPGQCLINNLQGQKEGNELFQAGYFSTSQLSNNVNVLHKKHIDSGEYIMHEQFIYDGSSVALYENNPMMDSHDNSNCSEFELFIGEPVQLDSYHTNFKFTKTSSANTLVVGKDSISAISIFYHSLLQLVQLENVKVQLLVPPSLTKNEMKYFEKLKETNNNFKIFNEADINVLLDNLKNQIDDKINGIEKPTSFLFIYDIYNFRIFRKNGYSQSVESETLQTILRDGPMYGAHLTLYSQTYKGFSETIDDINYKGDFDIKIQLNGGESERLMEYAYKAPIMKDSFGIIKSPFYPNETNKFKVYSLPKI